MATRLDSIVLGQNRVARTLNDATRRNQRQSKHWAQSSSKMDSNRIMVADRRGIGSFDLSAISTSSTCGVVLRVKFTNEHTDVGYAEERRNAIAEGSRECRENYATFTLYRHRDVMHI